MTIFTYGPVYGWLYSLFDYRIGMRLKDCAFVGLKYFKIALSGSDLPGVLINTLAMSFLAFSIIPLAAIFAILLSEMRFKRYGKFLQTATTLPNFMSWIIVFAVFSLFFSPGDGVLNTALTNANIIKEPLNPLGNVDITWFFQTGIKIWKELGYNSIIFFAAISGIDTELYDAVKVDGAGRYRTIMNIVVPGLMPTLITLLLINVGFILNGFDQVYVFYNGLVAPKINVLDYYVYHVGLQTDDIPFATALSVSKTLVSVILVFSINFVAKRIRGSSIV
jgi:ABC-type polysaccharide transport system, permease component